MLFHARAPELASTLALLSLFATAPVTGEVVDDAATVFRRWHPSHGLDEHDAILAATVLKAGGRLVSQNAKHFPRPGLDVERAWGGR